ncbi:MAG: AAA family ATPase [Muribaculaceae bacterium]|nr:AAA family ATPase [Muribaculaceae bacterium]
MKSRYDYNLLTSAERLDAIIGGGVFRRCVSEIIDSNDTSAVEICGLLSNLAKKEDKEIIKLSVALKNDLIAYYGYKKLSELCKLKQVSDSNNSQSQKTLDELMTELNELVGLKTVKDKVLDLIAFQRIRLLRKNAGLVSPKSSLHMAFTGNPGTGKTTVARIIGRIYKQIGLLSIGHFTEVSRTDLIAGYQGQTAHKVKGVIEKSKGGVLFIDEAYSLTENDHSDSYGRECLTELTKALEDYREDLVVIVAGYTKPMEKFFESNPGLKSRFNTFVQFDDYNLDELMSIMKLLCQKESYILPDKVLDKLEKSLAHVVDSQNEDSQFANGRYIRNIFEEMVMNHSRRVAKLANPSMSELQIFLEEDLPTEMRDMPSCS